MSTRLLALMIAMLAFSPGFAGKALALSITYQDGVTSEAAAITEFRTRGGMIAGLEVMAVFSDGESETMSWVANSGASGGVIGSGWSLIQSGDTFRSAWTLSMDGSSSDSTDTPSAIAKLVLNAGPGSSVFDIQSRGTGTRGSELGGAFELEGDYEGLSVTYSDRITISGRSPVGDLYNTLTLAFSEENRFSAGQSLRFVTDMDNLITLASRSVEPLGDGAAVPIPSAVWLFISSLAGLAGIGRWPRKT
ncbi:hypothetical protein [Thiorhodococcus minor]|uniref:VPLPA-CTERM sorting domain-containing protein n=1 Tax=Thiorhodococcus minor TaxID=57489 RepID=A0A6M0JXP7_9GAMM|nr:hypothetical protein [Thiorhodococcus minor]NEV61751.1 hypothetical protein [Thiorhodococcus minor]